MRPRTLWQTSSVCVSSGHYRPQQLHPQRHPSSEPLRCGTPAAGAGSKYRSKARGSCSPSSLATSTWSPNLVRFHATHADHGPSPGRLAKSRHSKDESSKGSPVHHRSPAATDQLPPHGAVVAVLLGPSQQVRRYWAHSHHPPQRAAHQAQHRQEGPPSHCRCHVAAARTSKSQAACPWTAPSAPLPIWQSLGSALACAYEATDRIFSTAKYLVPKSGVERLPAYAHTDSAVH